MRFGFDSENLVKGEVACAWVGWAGAWMCVRGREWMNVLREFFFFPPQMKRERNHKHTHTHTHHITLYTFRVIEMEDHEEFFDGMDVDDGEEEFDATGGTADEAELAARRREKVIADGLRLRFCPTAKSLLYPTVITQIDERSGTSIICTIAPLLCSSCAP
jgi:hypothetical protein